MNLRDNVIFLMVDKTPDNRVVDAETLRTWYQEGCDEDWNYAFKYSRGDLLYMEE